MLKKWIILISLCGISIVNTQAQIKPTPSNEIQLGLQKLNTLGSVLYFAAHPDDENTRLIAWLAQEKKYRTAYLSLTRGDGGQNLIGTEQGIELGLIRTQELLAARAIDKGEQLFSSAYDFGFSKTHDETFTFWDKETALREAVYIIRKLQPDVIINRFPPDKRGGHGHHQASAMLAHEAFIAAADPNMFADQLETLKPWKAKRLLWNTANFGGANNTAEDQLKIEIGAYNPLLGKSYGEIAAQSRSQHKSQGFGAASTRGQSIEYFALVDGDSAINELMDDVETSWKRIDNSEKIESLIVKINKDFNPLKPENSINDLFQLRTLISQITNEYWKAQKLTEIDNLIIACAGLWIDASTLNPQYPVDIPFTVNIETIIRNPNLNVELLKANTNTIKIDLAFNKIWKGTVISSWDQYTQPYWLTKAHSLGKFDVHEKDLGNPTNPQKPTIDFLLKINGHEITVTCPITYKKVDPVQGELYQDIVITPKLTATLSTDKILCTNGSTQKIMVSFTRNDLNLQSAQIIANKIEGWQITPQAVELDFTSKNTISQEFEIKPITTNSPPATLDFTWNNAPLHSIKTIKYEHIPSLTWFPIAKAKIQNLQIVNPIKKIGYIAGAGDLVAQSLNSIGIETTILDEQQITPKLLAEYDAIVVGVRYFNVNSQSQQIMTELLQYVKNGGTVLIQYNVSGNTTANNLGPYPFNLSRQRVTEEDAVVTFDKDDLVFKYPNEITDKDFENWIQERGLYFADNIDTKYRTPIQINDKNELPNNGSLLIANYGKGKFVYTSLAFFRQLPAGVPGAYRLFVNLLAKENK